VFTLAPLLVGGRDAEDVRPLRPGIRRCPRVGWARDDLELMDALGALAMDRAQAVRPGISATDDDHVLPLGGEERPIRDRVARDAAVLHREELHGEVDARELAPWDRQIAR